MSRCSSTVYCQKTRPYHASSATPLRAPIASSSGPTSCKSRSIVASSPPYLSTSVSRLDHQSWPSRRPLVRWCCDRGRVARRAPSRGADGRDAWMVRSGRHRRRRRPFVSQTALITHHGCRRFGLRGHAAQVLPVHLVDSWGMRGILVLGFAASLCDKRYNLDKHSLAGRLACVVPCSPSK